MKIGIIVAMSKELALLTPMLENKDRAVVDGYGFITGRIGSHDIMAMECGIGKVNAAMGTYAMLGNFSPDLVLSTGVAGGADDNGNDREDAQGDGVDLQVCII